MRMPASRASVYFGTPAMHIATFTEDGSNKFAPTSPPHWRCSR
jgi:hypothetical protein